MWQPCHMHLEGDCTDEVLCPVCGGPNFELDEPHYSALKYSESADTEFRKNFIATYGPEPEENSENDHSYWRKYSELSQKEFECPGPPYSTACKNTWIALPEGPDDHAKCDEECYCRCHYPSTCACPEPDETIDPGVLAIVCPLHGRVY